MQNSNRFSRFVQLVVLGGFFFSFGFLFSFYNIYNTFPFLYGDIPVSSQISRKVIPEDILDYSRIQEAYEVVSEEYYGFSTVKKEDIESGMIQGMVEALGDPHSEYFNEEETKKFNEAITWNLQGIGAYVGKVGSGVLVRQTFEHSPAREGGILEGDIITSANKESLQDLSIEEAVMKIKWPAGTTVVLQILRSDGKNFISLEKTVIRRAIQVPSVVSKKIEGTDIWLITVGIFGETTPEEFERAYVDLTNSGKIQGVVLDLRDNPGGLLSSAVSILSSFVQEGKLVVETRGTRSDLNQKYFSAGGGKNSLPLVVLINQYSASASEIVAGAVQDYRLGTIVWEKSYGKGSVQETFPQPNASELKITVARWYTPNGKWIDKIGIIPDKEIQIEDADFEKQFDRQLEWAKEIILSEISKKSVTSKKQ